MVRLLASPLPPRSNFIYGYAQTSDHEAAVLERSASLLHTGLAPRIAIAAQEAATGNPGSDVWVARLERLKIQTPDIVLVPQLPRPDSLNTLTETQSFVQYAKDQHWRTVTIVAPAFHLPRAYITAVSVARRMYPALQVYPVPAMLQDWNEVATHSQGVLRARRDELLRGEFERIHRYFEKGDLLHWSVALQYLRYQ